VPTYEYRCDNCATNFDVVQSFQDDALTECPTCGSPVRKVFGSVGIVFKGSGFYKTDSRSGGAKAGGAEPTVPAAAASDNGGPGSESSGSPDSSSGPSESSPSTPAPATTSSNSSSGSGKDGSKGKGGPSSTPAGKSAGKSAGSTAGSK
jgi:putative FmdB family regulatory protein